MSLDDIDVEIVTAMESERRVSTADIADRTGVPETVVRRRLRALEKHGVLQGYVPQLDYEALGYPVTVVVRLAVDGDHLTALAERLRDEKRLIAVYEVTGTFDIVAIGKYADGDEVKDHLVGLQSDPAVCRTDTSPVLTVAGEFEPVDLTVGDGG